MTYLTAEDIIKMNGVVIRKYLPNEPVGFAGLNSLQRTEISLNDN